MDTTATTPTVENHDEANRAIVRQVVKSIVIRVAVTVAVTVAAEVIANAIVKKIDGGNSADQD
jgi:hexokinase